MTQLLAGKVVFITGAARGQGRHHAVRVAREGANVIAVDVCAPVSADVGYAASTEADLEETARLVRAEGGEIFTAVADVRDLEALRVAVAAGVEKFGRLDVVIANAGIATWGRFWEMPEEQWSTLVDINLNGVWRTMTAAVPAMIEAGNGGSIVIVSSAAGVAAAPGCAHYSAAKHGLVGLARTAATELGAYDIRVNSIHPGAVETEMGNDPNVGKILTEHPEYMSAYSWPLTSVRRTNVEDISNAVMYLATDLSRAVTGTKIVIDMGQTMA
ncbi:mycofactocin-coupled SDR family oxidoreductase [Rhodococcus sp. IEGM 1379]|uniref:mycofactocin-coupled SDR family oxidoreductase n=1 Tax=Rhodococcus sp. IEGM 1379 TaxID=3047086 RepID=UPI0024B73DC9|nr:mycofactocin-coupled SDR family oxidoreductase [Rhodococcus sp. IEGM 1379]MDI9914072.1 mycofactocin-coupled SDR family oxidoreductase [Rhodococcus sp. IEGM 1379]